MPLFTFHHFYLKWYNLLLNSFIKEKCWRINPSVHNFLQTGRRRFIYSYLIFFTVWFCENKDSCHVCKFKLTNIERTRLLSACLKVKINIKIINLWVYSGMKEYCGWVFNISVRTSFTFSSWNICSLFDFCRPSRTMMKLSLKDF